MAAWVQLEADCDCCDCDNPPSPCPYTAWNREPPYYAAGVSFFYECTECHCEDGVAEDDEGCSPVGGCTSPFEFAGFPVNEECPSDYEPGNAAYAYSCVEKTSINCGLNGCAGGSKDAITKVYVVLPADERCKVGLEDCDCIGTDGDDDWDNPDGTIDRYCSCWDDNCDDRCVNDCSTTSGSVVVTYSCGCALDDHDCDIQDPPSCWLQDTSPVCPQCPDCPTPLKPDSAPHTPCKRAWLDGCDDMLVFNPVGQFGSRCCDCDECWAMWNNTPLPCGSEVDLACSDPCENSCGGCSGEDGGIG